MGVRYKFYFFILVQMTHSCIIGDCVFRSTIYNPSWHVTSSVPQKKIKTKVAKCYISTICSEVLRECIFTKFVKWKVTYFGTISVQGF